MAENQQLLDYLKKVAADLYETRERLRELESGEQEPIAVVGMGCRLPGGVADPDQFWELLAAGGDAIGAFPADRGWDVIEESFGLNQSTDGGDAYSRTGGFVHDAPDFDAGFFGISPREALAMDPQQRILLEVAWETLEHGGINPATLKGTKTGVFVGANSSGYGTSLVGSGSAAEGYVLTGGLTAVISGRVSYTLGLEGPAVTVDTACSSASVALHLACQSLRTGESTMALAGGVAVMALPGAFAEFSKQQGMAADGRCKAFGAGADGIGWAEGSGMVLLERLSDARRNGHQILAVIRGTAVNQDGASNGLSAPNGPAQQRVIRAALAHSHLSPSDVDAVEAHGTGTTLGDPIEAGALLATYGQDRHEDKPLWLGSVKSNIGHPQTASGAISLIKVVLALRNELLPQTLHAEEPSPHIDWTEGNVQLLQEAQPWPKGERPRRAGISAFGISGTNVHMIVEEAPEPEDQPVEAPDEPEPIEQPKVLVTSDVDTWLVSGRSADGLAAQAGRLREFIAGRPAIGLADVGWTLANGRATFENRSVVIGSARDELQAGLAAVATGQPGTGVVTGTVPATGLGRTAFVFPGQGSQWVGMGRELLAASPVFAARFAECEEALAPFVDWSLYDLLNQQLETADQVQPVLWAMMVSLAAVWQAAGVIPDAVIGHSQGEIAAAVVAGILSLEDGARVVALRSQALKPLAGKGGMASIAEPADTLRTRLTAYDDRLSIAAVNGPAATVVAGEPEALRELVEICKAEDVRARIIPVDYASHSAQIDALEAEIKRALADVTPTAAQIPMLSAMSGEWLAGPELDADYWYASLRSPVEFDRAIRTLATGDYQIFIEASPHPVLTGAIGDSVEAASGETTLPAPVITGTLRRDEGGPARLITSLAEVHVHGVPVDWATILPQGTRTALPTYAFQHQRYWAEAMPGTRSAGSSATGTGTGSVAEASFWAAVEEGDLRELADRLSVDDERLAELLPALASWRRRERAESAVADWRYRVSWVPASDSGATVLDGTWLAVIPQASQSTEDVAETIMGAIDALGERGVSVLAIDVAPTELDRAALTAKLAEAAATAHVAGVLSFLALDETPTPAHPAVPSGTAGTLLMVQALGDAGIVAPLWVVTQGAVSTNPSEIPASAAQAQVWGLGRVAGLEHLDRWGGLIDLPPQWDERVAARLCTALGNPAEDQVAIRSAGTLARRLIRARARKADAGTWTPAGTVLVTGATGEIGPYLGRWLADRGAERVVLTSRSGPWVAGGAAAAVVAELAAQMADSGTSISLLACDLTDRTQVGALLDRIAGDGPPLKTVLHAANAGRMVSYDGTDLHDLDVALGAKGVGAVVLDALTQDLDLDHFVLFSSIAATWGSAEHAAYAAGNAYLDALAQQRRARGLPATAVAWGVWDTQEWTVTGAVVPDGPGVVTPARLMRQGMNFLAPDRAVAALEQVLADDETFIAVADVDWVRFAPVFRAMRNWPLFDGLPEVRALSQAASVSVNTSPDTAETSGLAGKLAAMAAAERERFVTDLVRTHAAAVLGHASADAVDAGRAFRDMGFDSLTAVDLRNRLNAATGLSLPSTVVFDYPSATVLSRQIITQLLGAAPATQAPLFTASIGAAASDEPIAIVGMGCRFPGGVSSPEQLWDLVAASGDAISGFPTDRGWDMTGLFDPDPDNPGTSYVQEGGFLHGAAQFDPGFFGISPREAIAMDPQQRMLLEVCWEALERAGIDPETLRGTLTGVFAGASPSGYAGQVIGIEGAEGHLITGNIASVLSGRISYTLGLEGPAVTVDTACSSSLVALHLACQSLHTGESTMALAGGVMVMADPGEFVGFSRQRALAADGRCKAFSDDADGMGIAEGAGMILLERLSDAQRNGHPILAVVKGSAMNQDGASNGLTAPNGPSQQRVIRAALANAQLAASEVDAVEAHGTGTALGDPIEAQALLATYGQDRPEDRPLWLGSVKSNIGHTQQAAGIAGVIKMVLALRQSLLPATLHAATPSTHIDWAAGDVRLLHEAMAWPHDDDRPRRAGVSAFGLSGTNAHVILEEAPVDGEAQAETPNRNTEGPILAGSDVSAWVVSGRGPDGLAGQAGRLREHVLSHSNLSAADIAWSLVATRARFHNRAVVVGRTREELTAGLATVATKQTSATVVSGAVRGTPRVGFVFAGQGAQRAGMGRSLYAASPIFAETFDRVAAILEAELGLPVADVVLGRAKNVDADQTVFAQTGLFAVQVALVEMLAAAGVRPDAVAGHSVGEIAASWAAGVLSLEDACRLVANRARLMQSLPEGGGMCSIAATEAEVLDSMVELGVARVGIGAVNGPRSTVVSGEAAEVDRIAEVWRERGRRVRPLRVSHAFHSVLMDPILDELGAVATGLSYAPSRVVWAQAATGQVVTDCAPSYWTEQARQPVRFADAVSTLAERGVSVFLEIGPDGTLSAIGTGAVSSDAGATFIPLLRSKSPAPVTVATALGRAHVLGVDVDWEAVLGTGRRVDLPTYAFQHQSFWPQGGHAVPHGTVETAAESDFWAAVEEGDVSQLADTLAIDGDRLADLLPALASWRRREREDSAVADWRYRVTWVPVTDPGAAVLSGTWLAVVPSGYEESTREYLRALTDRGANVVTLTTEPADLDRTTLGRHLSQLAATAGDAPIAGILSLLALDEAPLAERASVHRAVAGTLLLVQALGDAGLTAPLWSVTRGAVATGPGEVLESPVQAQVWGLGRVVGLEHSERWGGLVDLPQAWDERVAARFCAVLSGPSGVGEDQVAVRSSGMVARRLVRATHPRETAPWTPGGSVLITGGTGGIGSLVARWATGRGASRVVLTSRSGAGASGVSELASELAALGTPVDVIACDMASRDSVSGLLARIAETGPALTSVIHAAGVGEATPIEEFTLDHLAHVSAVKTTGAVLLDELTADLDLDAFVLFSSVSATWGSGLQPGYAAANAFLDALAETRRARGRAATSVAWGLWGGAGMGSGEAGENLHRYGLRQMDPELGIRALAQAIDGRETEVTVADVDWQRFAPLYTLRRTSPLLELLPEVRQALAGGTEAASGAVVESQSELVQRLSAASRAEQERLLIDLVRTEAAQVLGHASVDAVEKDRAFNELGFDSLTAMELRNRLNAVTGLTLPATLAFDYPTSVILAGHLRDELLGTGSDAAVPVVAAAASDEPIAIVGMGCRLPGGVGGPEQLWDLVMAGIDAMSPFPQDRGWEAHEPQDAAYARVGGFVYDATEFDAGFFGISPREAVAMDPQQRLLLEVAWEALERAGIDPHTLRGSATGVFAGASGSGYDIGLLMAALGGDRTEGHAATGNAASVVSGRVAYALGLEGPAVTVDTACSSSLVALHLACQSLRSGECAMALAGGVTVMATPGTFGEFSKQQGMSSDGRCKAFSDDADGTGWAEGAGMVLLERLSDAERNGHNILAIVRGSAINQDGASNGLTAPNGPAQQRVIRAALANARLTTSDVDVVEAHGTGTKLGDPIEAQALLATYGQNRPTDEPLRLGTIKSNIGHAQQAAGVAGIIKMVMALRHGVLPRTLHAEVPSTHVDWSAGNIRLLHEAVEWTPGERPRRAGVSAFGMSGTNAHVIVEEAPVAEPIDETPEEISPASPRVLAGADVTAWLISARSAEALAAQAGRLREFALARSAQTTDIAWSLATTRSVFEHRAVVVGGPEGLAAIATGQPGSGVVSGSVPASGLGWRAFVFPGQGSQWVGMGRELLATSPVFAARFAECAEALAPFVDWSLYDLLDQQLETADQVQPVLWAMMVSLAAVWQAAGVIPDVVIGHSQGEIAAAAVAGALSLSDAAKVVALRSQALKPLAGKGGMLSIAQPVDQVRERIEPFGARVSIAAVNGASATVVSGEPEALQEILAACEADEVRARMISVDYASHSAQVDALESEIKRVLAGITPTEASTPMISAMSGEMLTGPELGPDYWYASLRSTVEFDRAIRTLVESGHRTFIEVSPHPVLTGAITDTIEDTGTATSLVIGTLRRDEGGPARLLTSLAEAHVRGVPVDWAAVLEPAATVDLPTYAFQHQRYWPRVPDSLAAITEGGSGGSVEDGFWSAVDRGDVAELADTLGIDTERLTTLLPALAAWRRRERADSAVAGWRYRIAWAPVADTAGTLSGSWLVAAGSVHDELTHQVVRALNERGARVVLLPVGAEDLDRSDLTEPADSAGSAIRADRSHSITLADRIRTLSSESPFTGVVSLLALDEDRLPDFAAVPRGLAATALLTQALADVESTATLWSLTRGAVSTGAGDQLTNPLQGQVWGLGRVAALELPDTWGGLIDLPQQWDERVATRLVAALSSGTEDQVAIRPAGVLARRLVHAPAASSNAEWTPSGSVLITGGTGGIGGHTARWLAGRDTGRVILTSRSGATASGAATLAAELANLGTHVDIVACDIAQRPHVAALLDRIAATGPALTGVVHAAGVSGGGTVLTATPADLAEHLAPKADGATWLDELTRHLDLEAFVVFSSGAAVWGSGSLAGYAAANAHLDAVVDGRVGRGLAGTSVAWGLWGGGGMVSGEIGEQLQRYGMRAMDSEPGIRALAQVLDGDRISTTIADVDWDRFAPTFTLRRPSPLIASLPEVQRALSEPDPATGDGKPQSQSELAGRLVSLSELEQTRFLVDLVRGETAAVLGYPSPEAVEAERAFRELGIDSVTAVELRNRLNATTGLRLPSTLVFDYPSAAAVADYLRDELIGTGTGSSTTVAGHAASDDPIAIVAMGCKIPGGVGGPEQFWELLANGVDAVGEFPTDRGWDVMEEAYWASLAAAGADTDIEIPHVGGFVYDAGEFDAGFFGISPREALAMDPQQRMLLEVSWETIERAGLNPHTLRGSRTGVFAGATYSGYGAGGGLDSGSEGYMLTGSLTAVISGRVSYTLGLEGPAVTVDTACSSSLVALHLACQSLRSGECEMALAGGVAVLAVPGAFAEFSKQQGMSTDGRSKAFSADADGIGWGEGAGMLLLERESDARRNGHPVLAVIKGSAMNQDGASNGLSAPNGPSQQRVIRAALANAQLTTDDIDIVEAHGTGTSLGDPIEAHALLATYGRDRAEEQPLWLGSVKSNIGHLQTASGVISIMKMVLAMQHAEMPQTLHAEVPSPHIDWSAGNVRLLQEARPWPAGERLRRAGVSAFGISGTNVHVIVEEAGAPEAVEADQALDDSTSPSRTPILSATDVVAWPVSARSHDALAAQAGRLREFALAHADQHPADVAWSLATTRSVFEHRAVAIGADRGELAAGLAAVATGQPAAGVVTGIAPSGGAGRSVFVFPGQGSQWVGMGHELLATFPIFAARFAECEEALAPFVDWSLYDLLNQQLETADMVQPVLWAMMVSLAAVWQAAGVTPDAVIGHSQGEIAAAVVAGILSLEDGARVVALRSQALKPLAGKGGMLSIALPADAVRDRIEPFGDRVSIAAINGASATVVSGEPEALQAIQAACEADEIRARMIPVDYASHSAQVDALEAEIRRVLAGITPGETRVPMISAMSGEMLTGPELGPDYWYASLRSTVEFDRAIRTLADTGHQVFIEVSPHPVLTGAITDTLEDRAQAVAGPDTVVLGTLRRDEGGPARLLASLAEAHVRGVGIDWSLVSEPAARLVLPTYAFQRERYWAEAAAQPITNVAQTESSELEARFWAAVEQGDLGELADTLALDDSQPLNDLLPALASWRRRERADSAVADWRYRVSWVPVADAAAAVLTGTWLVVVPQNAEAAVDVVDIRSALTDRGADVAVLEISVVDLDRATLAARLTESVSGPIAGIVSLLAFDDRPVPGFPAVSAGVAGSLLLIQALGDAGIDTKTWSLTSGAVGANDRPTNLVQSEVWGLGRVAGLEHLDRWGGLIDLPSVWDDRTAARLVAALADGSEDQIAIRATGTLARRVVRAKARRTNAGWTPTGTVLVTGATGKIGPYVAEWLTARGAERVVLTSRSGPAVAGAEAQVAELVAGMAGNGTGVSVLACDIADRDDVAGLLARVTADGGPPLKHVLHTANAGRMVSFDGTDLRDLDIALGAKASGAVWLDELTRDLDLDDFVLFSSIAAMWGSAEHAAYAAGNAFLDALAEDRRSRGLPATSVAWGVWDTQQWGASGAALPDGPGVVTPARLARQGMNFLAPDRALTALGQVLADDETFIAVADVDWARFAPVFSAMRHWPLFDGLPEVRKLAATAPREQTAAVAQVEGELAHRLLNLSPAERERTVTDLVRTHAAAVLGHSSADAVSAGRAFRDLGFESLTVVELRNRLNAATGLTLPSTVVFDYPSATVLARQIITQLLGTSQGSAAQPVAQSVLDEPVAIIGMGCRFPGGVTTPDQLWQLVAARGDAISGFPTDRGWDMTGLFDPDPDSPGTSYVQEGGFLDSAASFDAPFFGISPREAIAMDPQQRLLLEVSWEALERAGIDPETMRGTLTGVFAGASPSGYATQVLGAVEGAEGHLIAGNATSVLSGRISYTLGMEGPAVTVDTACSSSLVALHLAAQALRNGECTMAIAGGVMVMADSTEFIGFSQQRALAADGRCKAFSDDADGMGIAEGAGMIVLERVSDARRNGHPILAVVRGSAINQDGASNGLTAPNGPSQQRVIRAALASARLSSTEIDAVEAHGTGTTLGDPIEAQALLATYGQDRPEDRPLWLGSVKSNIGHAQQAAGIAGVIKTVLALKHELLPATLYADEPSTHVDWTAGHVRLLNEPVAWRHDDERPRRAGVSAFGLSGTNAHVIIEEAPPNEPEPPTEETFPTETELPVLESSNLATWLVSSRTADGLADQAARLREHALVNPELETEDIGWSLATSRTVFQHRAVVISGATGAESAAGSGDAGADSAFAASRESLLGSLAAIATGQPDAGVVRGSAPASGLGRTVFVFPGQGGQWVGMGKELLESSPVFAARFAECAAALAPHLDWSVRDVVSGTGGPELEAAEVVQPVLWAMMVSLAAVWQAAGVSPDAVVGHSQGEIAAAVVAGILSLEDGARVVALRSQSLRAIAGVGGMLSLAEPADRVRERLAAYGDRASVAAVNGPAATVVSGEPAALREIQAACEAEDIRARMIPVDYASHSAQVDALQAEILRVLTGISPSGARIPMISAMSGEWLVGPEMDADYWYASLRSTVEFDRAIRTLSDTGHQVFIEVSPHPVVTGAVADTLDAVDAASPVVTGTLRRDDGGPARLVASLAEAWTHGVGVDWTSVLGRGERVELPTYAFQHQRFWPEAKSEKATVAAGSPAESGFWAAVEDGDVRQLADTLAVDDERLADLLPALASWRRREREDNAVADWRYKATWTPITDTGSALLSGTWLAVIPTGFHEAAANPLQTLRDRGAEVVTVEFGTSDLDRAALAARLAAISTQDEFVGVLSFLAFDESPVSDRAVIHTAVAASLVLVQALGDAGVAAPLWSLTQGAVSIGAGDPLTSVVQAQVWGLGRVVALEHADRWGGLVDLPAGWDERIAARFASALTGDEDQIAVRAAGSLARRLVRAPQPQTTAPWLPNGSVLITGGTGGIGGHTARWLADRGAPHLVLTSRSGAGAEGVAALAAEVAAKGARVDVVACDMADRAQVGGLLDGIDDLVGVIHSAGVGEATPIGEFTLDHLERVSAVKTAGAVLLDELTSDLEVFVVFSSVSATWGSGLQPGYAAANAFLDALAEDRRARGLAATSVAWGLWDGGGMGSGESADQLQRYGLRLMDPALGIRGLAQAVDGREVAVSVADVDWERFAPTFTMHRPSPLLATIPEAHRALAVEEQPVAAESRGELVQRLAGQSRGDQERLLGDLVRAEAAAVLGYASADAVEPERAFKDLGVDSVTAVELRNRLNAATGLRLSSTLVFDYPNPATLAAHLREQLAPEDGGPASIFDELGRLESALAGLDPADASHQDVTRRLQGILSRWIGTRDAGRDDEESGIDFESATSSEVFDFLDNELGLS